MALFFSFFYILNKLIYRIKNIFNQNNKLNFKILFFFSNKQFYVISFKLNLRFEYVMKVSV